MAIAAERKRRGDVRGVAEPFLRRYPDEGLKISPFCQPEAGIDVRIAENGKRLLEVSMDLHRLHLCDTGQPLGEIELNVLRRLVNAHLRETRCGRRETLFGRHDVVDGGLHERSA